LKPALSAARNLKCFDIAPAQNANPAPQSADIVLAIANLRDHLNRRSMRARSSFDALMQVLGSTANEEDKFDALQAVKSPLDKLDYEQAQSNLDEAFPSELRSES